MVCGSQLAKEQGLNIEDLLAWISHFKDLLGGPDKSVDVLDRSGCPLLFHAAFGI